MRASAEAFTRYDLQHVELFFIEVAPVPAREIFFGKTRKIHAVQLHHPVIELFEDPAHDAVAARVDLYADLVLRITHVIDGIGFYGTVFELNAPSDGVKITALEVLIQGHMVYFFDAVARVGEALGEFPIIGKKQDARGAAVQPSYRINALTTGAPHQFHHIFSSFGIVQCGDVIFGFIEEHVLQLFLLQGLSTVVHHIARLYFESHFSNDLPVHLNRSRPYQVIGLAPRANARVRDVLIETNSSIIHFFFIKAGGSVACFLTVFFLEGLIVPEALLFIPALLSEWFFLKSSFFVVKALSLEITFPTETFFLKSYFFIVKTFSLEITLPTKVFFLKSSFFVVKTFSLEITLPTETFFLRSSFFVIRTLPLKITLFARVAFLVTVRMSFFVIVTFFPETVFFMVAKTLLLKATAVPEFLFAEAFIDRKSTRLNSSH